MNVVRAGFTGTQDGMTVLQKLRVAQILESHKTTEFHHGDCVGSDAEAHLIARNLSIPIVIHPPDNIAKRAFCKGYREMREPYPYLVRNKVIVNETDFLIATPKSDAEELRSGTWSTVRYAHKTGKIVWIVTPGGQIRSNAPLPANS